MINIVKKKINMRIAEFYKSQNGIIDVNNIKRT